MSLAQIQPCRWYRELGPLVPSNPPQRTPLQKLGVWVSLLPSPTLSPFYDYPRQRRQSILGHRALDRDHSRLQMSNCEPEHSRGFS